MAAHYGDIPTGGTEIDVLPTNAAAYRVRLVVRRTRADNEILARIRTCAGSNGHIAKNNVVGVVVVQFVNGDLSRAIFIGLRFRSGGSRVGIYRGNRIWVGIHRGNRIWIRIHIPRSDECNLLRRGGANPLTRFYVIRSQRVSRRLSVRKIVQSVVERYQSRVKTPVVSAQLHGTGILVITLRIQSVCEDLPRSSLQDATSKDQLAASDIVPFTLGSKGKLRHLQSAARNGHRILDEPLLSNFRAPVLKGSRSQKTIH